MDTPRVITADTKVRRYLSLWAAVDILRTRQMRLTLVEHLRQAFDPFEGTLPYHEAQSLDILSMFTEGQRNQQQQWAAHFDSETRQLIRKDRPAIPHQRETELRREGKRKSVHVSCWMAGPESDAMWKLYGGDGGHGFGVCLQATYGTLKDFAERHKLNVRPVKYRTNERHEGEALADDDDQWFWKREGFFHEHEARIAHYDSAHYEALMRGPSPPDLETYTYRAWEPAALGHVTVSPYADEAYARTAHDALTWAAGEPSFEGEIELSVLHPGRFKPRL